MDERISRERAQIVMRVVNTLRHSAEIVVMGGGTTEDELLKKLEERNVHLVLLPWYRYLAWSKAEAFFGLTRTNGPTIAGYFADQLRPYELGDPADHLRAIFLDFAHLTTHESLVLLRSLIPDFRRAGIRPLIDPTTPIYCENWYGGQGHGTRIETILSMSEIANDEWQKRAAALRISLMALWSLVYEEGPGKGEFAQAAAGRTPKAYFQMGVDRHSLMLRLCYSMGSMSPKDALGAFWPNAEHPTAPAQLLTRYADFVRVHTIAEAGDVEITVGFFPSAPADKAPQDTHTLWIEPLSAQVVTEVPFEAPSPANPYLRALPGSPAAAQAAPTHKGPTTVGEEETRAKERFIFNAASKIRELKKALYDRDEVIKELRSGGVGTAPSMPPPDAEGLLEAFQERYFEARYQIRQFEIQIRDAETLGASPQALEQLRQKIQGLILKEQQWIQKIAQTLEMIREARRTAGSGSMSGTG